MDLLDRFGDLDPPVHQARLVDRNGILGRPFEWLARLLLGREPGGLGIRNDSGVYEGVEVSIHYDPMISKLCTKM